MIGQTISHYKILDKLGEGGMGVVYKAEDTKLDRIVALKFLPHHLTANDAEKARFLQEAKAASALNHPNVCTIHDIQEHDGTMFIVMECVVGQTLRERKDTIAMKQAIDIGIQIADGLAAAHEKGIVHRDIKPENIMIRKDGIAQIMDFGLAKLRASGSKITRLTKEGSTVGTAGYMSPEQVQGQEADHRSDIFSLGVLLYELFTGQLPFKGVHETALAYEIVNVDAAPPSSVKPEIEPELDRIVLECLDKDQNERTQSVKQVAIDLKRARRESGRQRASRITAARPVLRTSSVQTPADEASDSAGSAAKRSFPWFAMAGSAIVAAIMGFGVAYFTSPGTIPQAMIQASIEMPAGVTYVDGLGGHTSISPDGSMIVFAAVDSLSQTRLWVRPLHSSETKTLSGTEGATYPFWSPESRMIGFFADGKLKTIDAAGGPVLTLAGAPYGRGAAWSKNGEILFAPSVSDPNLYAVPASGGTPRRVTAFDSTSTSAPRFPFFLPDGKHFVFSMLGLEGASNTADMHVGSLEMSESKEILKGVSSAQYASGHVFFLRQGILMTQAFDPASFALSGAPVPLQGNINSWPGRAKADYSVSETGVLVFSRSVSGRDNEYVWINANGSEEQIFQSPLFTGSDLSPDGKRIAFDVVDDQTNIDVWVYDITSKAKMRLTFAGNASSRPVWSSDGTSIYFNMEVGGSKANIAVKRADGSGKENVIARGDAGASIGYYASDVSPDGRFLLLGVSNESNSELATVDLQGSETPFSVKRLGIPGSNARFSPDGRWIVYESKESGTSRIYVASFGGSAGKWQLSPDGGSSPLWKKDKIIYYAPPLSRFEQIGVSFVSGTPIFAQSKPLFPPGKVQNTIIYGVSPDGQKYLAMVPVKTASAGRLSLVVNWQGLLEAK